MESAAEAEEGGGLRKEDARMISLASRDDYNSLHGYGPQFQRGLTLKEDYPFLALYSSCLTPNETNNNDNTAPNAYVGMIYTRISSPFGILLCTK